MWASACEKRSDDDVMVRMDDAPRTDIRRINIVLRSRAKNANVTT